MGILLRTIVMKLSPLLPSTVTRVDPSGCPFGICTIKDVAFDERTGARLGPKRTLICDGSGLKPLPVIVTTSPGCAAIGAIRLIVGAAYKGQTHQRRISTVAQAETAGFGKGRRSNPPLSFSRQESPLSNNTCFIAPFLPNLLNLIAALQFTVFR